ncbi:hypothetical protein O181_056902 [Austropuccinia psidii MF-1]|uniref:Uncharacterized protein n=1 Tax=Austropuccinia psidii MF-1 TaxID=1389203 RepID=A0A9Q3EGP8_9BASI|nr:hypothetical protein [Austropuccinia psidii MF-1]
MFWWYLGYTIGLWYFGCHACALVLSHRLTSQQPTPGLSGTQWLEDLSREPSQRDEPPIPGPSPSSKPPEDIPTCETEPEVAPMQSTEDPFACPATPHSVIIIDNTPIGSPLV